MVGLKNTYVQTLMYKCSSKPTKFQGCYSCDVFSRKISKFNLNNGDCFIINLAKSNHYKSGHFVAIYVESNKVVHYFDSFGMRLFDKFIIEALNKKKLKVKCFDGPIQHQKSHFCGLFCGKIP